MSTTGMAMRCRDCSLELSYGTWIDGRGPWCVNCADRYGPRLIPGCQPLKQLTEEDVRRIVSEELEKFRKQGPMTFGQAFLHKGSKR